VNDPEKGGNARIFKISRTLTERLKEMSGKFERIFGDIQLKTLQKMFANQRKRIARKTRNPRLQRITFHTLRHWFATMQYHRTKDILYVMKLLGHKNITNTLIYTQLVNFDEEEYVSKVAWNLEEACRLVEAGYEYVCEMEGAKIFRRRK
jgi:integrase